MNAIAAPLSRRAAPHALERATFGLLLAFIASLQLSIAAANVLLAATGVCWMALLARGALRPAAPPFFVPLMAYAGITLLSALFSLDPVTSLVDSRQLLLFAVVPIVYTLAPGDRAPLAVTVVISVGAISAAMGLVQYALLHYDTLGRRPDGALTHYMTYSGTLMLAVCATAAHLVFSPRNRTWPALVMPALVVALALTLTRSAWVGASVAVALLFVQRDFRLMAVLPVAVALVFAVAPDTLSRRMLSIVDLQDPSNRDRVAMLRAGAAMIADDPLTGVGPDMIPRVYEAYRTPDAVNPKTPHLHNVPLQIAAERGIPALAVWLWFIGSCALHLARRRRSGDRTLVAMGLAVLAATLAAGLFEYNFGDSEFLMLFLVLVTLPFAAARAPRHAPLEAPGDPP